MRRGRNPRRSYDEQGREIAPPTIGALRAEGETTAAVSCHGCRRRVVISTDPFPADLPFPDMALRLRCSECASRNVSVMKDMKAHYERITAATGWKMEPKPWPKLEPASLEPDPEA
ncbi:hypothetical protein VQ02_18565 [Methylobacterium variabile]|uniref:Uncharacterized protein n=1 Tax=Methylobacterium variabile TaxID=298794 RepID=A0A0J6SM93_9HYPH|nr:hypothetical protein [Methylobacterium variabile]KMO34762.1 hypothetical protein VQ02_18565 [Methylobacterium variabile]